MAMYKNYIFIKGIRGVISVLSRLTLMFGLVALLAVALPTTRAAAELSCPLPAPHISTSYNQTMYWIFDTDVPECTVSTLASDATSPNYSPSLSGFDQA